jgi:hypothetical protein
MILMPNATRCPACGRFVYAIDDLFAAQPWVGVGQIPGFEPGLYHYACFRSAPLRDAYLRTDAAAKNRVLDEESPQFLVLARTQTFALALRPAIATYVLYFLPWGRQLEFPGTARWKEFLALMTGPNVLQPTPAGSRGHVRLRREQDGWELATRLLVPIYADFTAADFARVRDHLTARGIDPARVPVELGALCRQLGVKPTEVDCPLDRLTGTFEWPEPPADSARPVTLTVQVESWYTVPLTGGQLEELRGFLRTLNRGE